MHEFSINIKKLQYTRNKEWESMKERHLRLVASSCEKTEQKTFLIRLIETFNNFTDSILTPENEKIYTIKEVLIKLYKDYEISTGIIDPPYYIKAEKRMIRIVKEKKIDHYYNMLKKYQNIDF